MELEVGHGENDGYHGSGFQKALAKILPQLETEIVKRSDRTKGFVVLPRRWVIDSSAPLSKRGFSSFES